MILILSENKDLSTTQVIEWLNILGKKWIRINREEEITLEYSGKDIVFTLENSKFKLSDIKSFWYRRGFFNINDIFKTEINEFNYMLTQEKSLLSEYLYYRLLKIHHLDSIKNSNVNKLIVNSLARDLEISTPEDYILTSKKHLITILNKSEKTFITKSISGDALLDFDDFLIFNYTSKVNIEDVTTVNFAPTLVQNCVEKKYELRIYYLNGKCYTMAIFSQNDNQTNMDFRNYNNSKPNRRVPFKLPIVVQEKLDLLMKKLDFNSGSIDMIVTPENEYVFLEVNPIGQFGMTSFPCNYNIEKKIAEYL